MFLRWISNNNNSIKVGRKKLKFVPKGTITSPELALFLDKSPYVDPNIEEECEKKIRILSDAHLRVDKIQIGLFYRCPDALNRSFSIEWEDSFLDKSLGFLSWEYEHKLIRV